MAHKYILDTPALVWYLEANPLLPDTVKAIIDDPASEMVLSIITLMEATYIIEAGNTSIPQAKHLLQAVQADARITIYPLTWEIFQFALSDDVLAIAEMHDRLLIATALHLRSLGHSVSLLTKEATITASNLVPIVW